MALSEVNVLLLCGGVGGAKLASGMARVLDAGSLAVLTNTGDDFTHFGLKVCPDLDTVLYTLAGLADRERGWGRADESWRFIEAVGELGGDTWFNLGDTDLATHVLRTSMLDQHMTLGRVTATLAARLSVTQHILPMSDDIVSTMVDTGDGTLPFQRYFVERRCEPRVTRVWFRGAEQAALNNDARALLTAPSPPLVVIAPSNPYLSIDPILALPGLREMLRSETVRVIAVSPIVAGKAIKGPTAKIMRELNLAPSVLSIAQHYAAFIDALVIDDADADQAGAIEALGVAPLIMPSIMHDQADRDRLAAAVLEAAGSLA
ncbi:MAG: 2-phospho-L-lactate transferase [Gammaproteobacteria bacterium]|nr:2-phospho-L-lactate transferase [Gammaproteobacteria bacterium]